MIKIIFHPNGFTATGHAYSAKYGSDLVCAGASAILMGCLNWFNSKSTTIIVEDNFIKVYDDNNNINHLLQLVNIQLEALVTETNKKYVSIQYDQELLHN